MHQQARVSLVSGMRIVDAMAAPTTPNPHGVDARRLYGGEHAEVVMITLKPGESLKRHITPVDVLFYVLEGEGIVEIGEEQARATKDMLIESPARIPHRWMNGSDRTFRVLVIKVPAPKEKTRIL